MESPGWTPSRASVSTARSSWPSRFAAPRSSPTRSRTDLTTFRARLPRSSGSWVGWLAMAYGPTRSTFSTPNSLSPACDGLGGRQLPQQLVDGGLRAAVPDARRVPVLVVPQVYAVPAGPVDVGGSAPEGGVRPKLRQSAVDARVDGNFAVVPQPHELLVRAGVGLVAAPHEQAVDQVLSQPRLDVDADAGAGLDRARHPHPEQHRRALRSPTRRPGCAVPRVRDRSSAARRAPPGPA